jgi:MOSC domain-containing protein YiiM
MTDKLREVRIAPDAKSPGHGSREHGIRAVSGLAGDEVSKRKNEPRDQSRRGNDPGRAETLGRSGTIASINISQKKGQAKTPVAEAEVVAGEGLKDDAHRGFAHRQVSLLMIESIETQRERLGGAGRIEIGPGAYAENLTTRGLDLRGVAVGDEFVITRGESGLGDGRDGSARGMSGCAAAKRGPGSGIGTRSGPAAMPPEGENAGEPGSGEVRLRVTQIGKECHTRCAIFKIAGECIMPELGIFCEVLGGGTVKAGDRIEKK